MEKNIVGKVTTEEKDEIEKLFNRKNALIELVPQISHEANGIDSELYEKVINDMGQVKLKMNNWWREMENKYKWKGVDGGMWNINFETCEIELLESTQLMK